jgi:transposase
MKKVVARKIRPFIHYDEIMALLLKEANPRTRERLQTMAWIAEGMKTEEIAERLGRNTQTIYRYMQIFDHSRLDGLLTTNSEKRVFNAKHSENS